MANKAAVPALEVRELSFRYGNRPALNRASLSVAPGVVCGLLGPNGSGKTTLFKCCLNFLRSAEGEVRVDGRPTARLSPAALARLAAYVPQEHRQAFPFPVRDVVRMGCAPHRGGLSDLSGLFGWRARTAQAARLTEDAMRRVGIAHLADVPCNQLSGGQRQLALIARAVAQSTPLMLLDEPTSALDFQNQMEVWNTLRQVAARGVAVVVCCHDPNHILWFCDQVVLMKSGRVLASGEPRAVLHDEALTTLYGDTCGRGVLNDGSLPVIYPERAVGARP